MATIVDKIKGKDARTSRPDFMGIIGKNMELNNESLSNTIHL